MEEEKEIVEVPACIAKTVDLSIEEATTLYQLLYKVLEGFKDVNE